MFAYTRALRLLLCMDVTNLRLLHGKKMNVTYLNTVLMKTFVCKGEAASRKFVILHNEELCDLYRSPDDASIGYEGMNMQLR
jgi:hypothetical protein